MTICKYILIVIRSIPPQIYYLSLFVFCVGLVVFVGFKGLKKGLNYSLNLLLLEYYFIVICSTNIYRSPQGDRKFDFTPFWSYRQPDLIIENIMNVVAFIPIGFLLGLGFKKLSWWNALYVGIMLSLPIEFMQLLFRKGFCEFDDVFHNVLGCMIGYSLFLLATSLVQRTSLKMLKNL